jgi:hypothetical protein
LGLLLEHAALRGCAEGPATRLCGRRWLSVRIKLRLGRQMTGESGVLVLKMTMQCMIFIRKTGVGHAHAYRQKPDEQHRDGCQSGSATAETERHWWATKRGSGRNGDLTVRTWAARVCRKGR